jgi:hypothetical protein
MKVQNSKDGVKSIHQCEQLIDFFHGRIGLKNYCHNFANRPA